MPNKKISKSSWLVAAGFYNILWGAWVVLFPTAAFDLLGIERPNLLFLWQCIGMIVGVYGIGYFIAANNYLQHWPIVLVGLLGKIFGPLGYLWGIILGTTPPKFGYLIIFNDLIWWIPFFLLLKKTLYYYIEEPEKDEISFEEGLNYQILNSKITLGELSEQNKILIVFLRHAGCTFCREAIAELSQIKTELQIANIKILIVFQSGEDSTKALLKEYNLETTFLLSDPDRNLYRLFDLKRGRLSQLLGIKELIGGIKGIFKGYGLGVLDGDGFQLAGSFLLENRKIIKAFRSSSASDKPDYCLFANSTN